jgi:hypothetical protein
VHVEEETLPCKSCRMWIVVEYAPDNTGDSCAVGLRCPQCDEQIELILSRPAVIFAARLLTSPRVLTGPRSSKE